MDVLVALTVLLVEVCVVVTPSLLIQCSRGCTAFKIQRLGFFGGLAFRVPFKGSIYGRYVRVI